MRTTINRVPRALAAVLGPLAALSLLLSVQGCSTAASATTTVAGPTQASALKVFNSFVTAERVAVANHDQLLAEALTSSSQFTLLSAEYLIAGATGHEVTAPTYGKPTLYVPKLTTYPQWFMATAPESQNGRAAGTALMVFDKPDASAPWTLDGTAILNQDAPALNVAVKKGYATALRTTDTDLEVRPDEVGAMQASVVDEGPDSAAASVVAPGSLTTGLYQANTTAARQAKARGLYYSAELQGTSYPFFALSTTDGGAIVFYTMSLNTSATPVKYSPKKIIPVPDAFKPLLPADHPRVTKLLDTYSTLQYVAIDPPPAKHGGTTGKLRVIGTAGGPNAAVGT